MLGISSEQNRLIAVVETRGTNLKNNQQPCIIEPLDEAVEDDMKSIVFIKRVPDTAANIRISGDEKVKKEGLEFVISPYDEYALEEAVQKKEEADEGEVVVMSLGGSDSEKTIRDCLARGGDRGVHLENNSEDWDPFSTAEALVEEVRDMDFSYDALWFGKHAVDDDGYQVGQIIAALLDLPVVTNATEVTRENGFLRCHREVEGGIQEFKIEMPCVITAEKGLNEPRYAQLQKIMEAKKKDIRTREISDPDPPTMIQGMEEPPERPPGEIVGEGPEAVPDLVRKLREEANVI